VEVTEETFAEKFTLLAPEGTVTEAGTPTALLVLVRSIVSPLLGAFPLIFTVQLSVSAPVIDEFAQLNPESVGELPDEPLPCSLIELPVVRLLLMTAATLSSPLSSVVEPGSKRTCATTLPPAGRV
jgi:hypothetical protein